MTTQDPSHSDLIKQFQKTPNTIRNICVLAHVDHGKTSLVDSLISYNNIISPRLAGDVRYMDSRPDEQERNITMKSSSISLAYHSEKYNNNYLINLIDSPGHVDFSYEIFSALKIVDGAIILIDVIEGICSQTESVIRQAWDENIKCVLVLNKIDKLITTVHLDPLEAYEHLVNLLEKVNALMASLIFRDVELENLNNNNGINNKKDNLKKQESSNSISSVENSNNNNNNNRENIDNIVEEKEKDFYFSPEKGNVIFASALDNWAFTIFTFADILSEKFKFKKENLIKVLWGDYYYNSKTKKLTSKPPNSNSKPIFVDFILNNIYKIYQSILFDKNIEQTKKIISSLKVEITQKELSENTINKNPQILLRAIMRQWLPIPKTIFDVSIEHLPNPIKGLQNKIDLLFPPIKFSHNDFIKNLKNKIKNGIINDENIPTVAYISKMIPIQIKNIQGIDFEKKSDGDEVKFMAFARVFTGEIKKGNDYYVIGPKHDSKKNKYDIVQFKFNNLYYFMGQFLIIDNLIPAGNIFSIGNLDKNIFKTGTISSSFDCPSIIPLNMNKNSNIKVSITTENLKELPILIEGLKKLDRCDPAVEYYMQSNGEHILVTSGEVHLERCIKDLEENLAKVKINISPPIVNFKEGLSNLNYTFKKKDLKKQKELDIKKEEEELNEIKLKERKFNNDMDEYYQIEGGENNIDIDDQEEILKSSMPMYITKKEPIKKIPKIAKHKVTDVIMKGEKKINHFIQKQNQNLQQKGFAEGMTSNKNCNFGISSFGMSQEMINIIEKNQKIIETIEQNGFEVDDDVYKSALKFKNELVNICENNKLKKIIGNYLYAFGTKDGAVNMLLIKHLNKEFTFFERIVKKSNDEDNEEDQKIEINGNYEEDKKNEEVKKVEKIEEEKIKNEEEKKIEKDKKIEEENKINEEKKIEKDKKIEEENKINEEKKIEKDTKNEEGNKKEECENKNDNMERKNINKNEKDNNGEHKKIYRNIDEVINEGIKNKNVSLKEFLNSIKIGFDLAIKNGPLCEENMYGVIFVLEFVEFNNPEKKEEKKEKEEDKKEKEEGKKEEKESEIKNTDDENKKELKNEIETQKKEETSEENKEEKNEESKENKEDKNDESTKENKEENKETKKEKNEESKENKEEKNEESPKENKEENKETKEEKNEESPKENKEEIKEEKNEESVKESKDKNQLSPKKVLFSLKVEETLENKLNTLIPPSQSPQKINPISDETTTKSDNKTKTNPSNQKSSTYGPFLGQIMSTIKETCRKSFLSGDPRLIEALYLCIFQINQENVGKIHSVVSKRRGEIINEIPSDENIKCTIEAIVPVAESFGFVEEIRKKSSGLANPMLRFYKWKIIDVDPFDIPSEDDIINFGVNVDSPNIAKVYINKIRQRKGLLTDEKIVKGADKQKNLAKKR